VSAGLVAQAATLARRHALRGYDAVQLAAALEIHATDPSLTLLSADAELNTPPRRKGFRSRIPTAILNRFPQSHRDQLPHQLGYAVTLPSGEIDAAIVVGL